MPGGDGGDRPYDALIFDLDGTLWNACAASARGWTEALARLGESRTVSAEENKSTWGLPTDECIDRILPGMRSTHPGLAALIEECETHAVREEGGKLFEGVAKGLPSLAGRYRLFLVSNCDAWYLEHFLDSSGLRPFFEGWDCHGASGLQKSAMLRRLPPSRSLAAPIYIGDTAWDQSAASDAGMDFAFAAYGFGKVAGEVLAFGSFTALTGHFLSLPSH